MGLGLKFLWEHKFFCYISNLEHSLFSISPLLHLPLTNRVMLHLSVVDYYLLVKNKFKFKAKLLNTANTCASFQVFYIKYICATFKTALTWLKVISDQCNWLDITANNRFLSKVQPTTRLYWPCLPPRLSDAILVSCPSARRWFTLSLYSVRLALD